MLAAILITAEVLLLLAGALIVLRVRRRFLAFRQRFGDFWLSLEEAVATTAGPVVARLIVGEPKGWAAIVLRVARRTEAPPCTYAYAAASYQGLIFVVVFMLIAVEGVTSVVVSRFLPWPWLSPVLLVISVYAAVWIGGIYSSLRAVPHRLTAKGLIARYGLQAEAWIPWESVHDVRAETAISPGGQDGLFVKDGSAAIAVGGKTKVALRLRTPIVVKGFLRSTSGVTELRLAADDPAALVAAISQHAQEVSGVAGREPDRG